MTDRIRCSSCGGESYADGATIHCRSCHDQLRRDLAAAEAKLTECQIIAEEVWNWWDGNGLRPARVSDQDELQHLFENMVELFRFAPNGALDALLKQARVEERERILTVVDEYIQDLRDWIDILMASAPRDPEDIAARQAQHGAVQELAATIRAGGGEE